MLNLVSSTINNLFLPTTIHNTSHHHPTSPLSPTAMAAHSCHRPPTTMAHDHQWQCGNATSLAAMTTRTDNPKRWTTPTNEYKQPYCSQTTASTYEQTQATTSQGETACLPPIHFSDTESRCHITDGDMATKWQMMMSSLSLLGDHGEYPPSPVPPNPPCSDTGWRWTDDVAQRWCG